MDLIHPMEKLEVVEALRDATAGRRRTRRGASVAVDVDHGEPVLRGDRDDRRRAGPDPVLLERRVGRAEPSHEELRRAAADRHRA